MINDNTASWKVSLFIITALVLLLGVILFIFFIQIGWQVSSSRSGTVLEKPTVVYQDPLITPTRPLPPPVEEVDPVLGAASPQLTIIYFSDFSCPYCQRMSEVFYKIIDNYGDKVSLVWKDLVNNPGSLSLHKAARCAQLQGSFWDYNKKLLDHQPTSGSSVSQLSDYAVQIGLDRDQFVDCLADITIEEVVFASTEQGINVGVDSTPAYFIGADYYDGFMEYEEIESIIKEKLGIGD